MAPLRPAAPPAGHRCKRVAPAADECEVQTIRLDTAYPEIVDLRSPDPALMPSASRWTDRQRQRSEPQAAAPVGESVPFTSLLVYSSTPRQHAALFVGDAPATHPYLEAEPRRPHASLHTRRKTAAAAEARLGSI